MIEAPISLVSDDTPYGLVATIKDRRVHRYEPPHHGTLEEVVREALSHAQDLAIVRRPDGYLTLNLSRVVTVPLFKINQWWVSLSGSAAIAQAVWTLRD